MEIKKKNLNRREWYTDSDRAFSCFYFKDSIFKGGIGLITFTGIKNPDIVETDSGELCIADKGYQWLELAPRDKQYVITAMFRGDELFQIYIDITLKNIVLESGDAEFLDMFLDVVIRDNIPTILDTDELDEALQENIITETDYNSAMRIAEELVDYYISNKNMIKQKLFEYRALF